jgi:hypothetical protein
MPCLYGYVWRNGSIIKPVGEFEKVVETKLNKSVLFANAQQWASSNDLTCKKSIEVQNNDNGSIVVKFELNSNLRDNSQTKYLTYKFRFSVKVD